MAVQYVVSPGFSKAMLPVPLPQLNCAHVVDVRLMVLIRTLPVLDTLMFTMSSVPAAERPAADITQLRMDDTGTNSNIMMVWAV